MPNCLFCKIIKGEIPSNKIFENDKVIAFLDIRPVNSGHTLVLPKEHFANLEDISEDLLKEVAVGVKKVGQAIKKSLSVAGYNVQVNNDPVAGQVVPHLHFHVIPRHLDDGLKLWPQEQADFEELADIAKKIKSQL